jgi:hypothetical protein
MNMCVEEPKSKAYVSDLTIGYGCRLNDCGLTELPQDRAQLWGFMVTILQSQYN